MSGASDEGETAQSRSEPTVHDRPLTPSRGRGALDIAPGTTVDRFVVIKELGEGGMGKVMLAYDPELDRKVALKFLRAARLSGRGGEEAQLRLVREAQAIARLTHPNVISVYDVGRHEDRVFLALEYVEGTTLREWIKQHKADVRTIVAKYIEAARGLAAAHRAGLIHRDFKSDNVLVGADGRPRVTDFGLARLSGDGDSSDDTRKDSTSDDAIAIPARSALDTPMTQAGTVMGTPGFIAPELYRGERADARSDQFALCAALYGVLYGVKPFAGTTPDEISSEVVAGRVALPARKDVPGWIRPILLRGLSVAPEARFPSVDALIDALERDPTVRRRRALVGIAALAIVACTGAAVYLRVNRADTTCKGAERRLASIWDPETRRAVEAAFRGTGLSYAPLEFAGASRLLDSYATKWTAMHTEACQATRLRGDQSEAILTRRMACLDAKLGELHALVRLFAKPDAKIVERAPTAAGALPALDPCADTQGLAAQAPMPQDPAIRAKVDQLRTRLADANALRAAGKFAQSTEQLQPMVAEADALGFPPLRAEVLYALASSLMADGKLKESVDVLRDSEFAAEVAHLDELAAQSAGRLTSVFARLTKFDEARVSHRHATAIVARMGGNERLEAQLLLNESSLLGELGKTKEQQANLEKALAIRKRVLGEDDPDTALTYYNLAFVTEKNGDFPKALDFVQRAIAIQEQVYGPDHPATAKSRGVEGAVYARLGDAVKAKAAYQRGLDSLLKSVGRNHPDTASAYLNYGNARDEEHAYAEALASYQTAVEICEQVYGKDNPQVANALVNVAQALIALDRSGEAIAPAERALAIQEQAYGKVHPSLVNTLAMLGQIKQREEKLDEAAAFFQRGIAIGELAGKDKPQLIPVLGMLSEVREQQKRYAEAIELLHRTRDIVLKVAGPNHPNLALILEGEAKVRSAEGKHAEARALFEQAVAHVEKVQGKDHPALSLALEPLGRELLALGEPAKALPCFERSLALRTAAKDVPGRIAMTGFLIGRALWDGNTDRKRALELALAAKTALADNPGELDEVTAWLKTHPL